MKKNIFITKLFLTSAKVSLFETYKNSVENKEEFAKYIFDEASNSDIINILLGEKQELQENDIEMIVNDIISETPTLISDEVKVGILNIPIFKSIILEFNSLLEFTNNYKKYKNACSSKEGTSKKKCLMAARIQSVNEYIKYLSDKKREVSPSKKHSTLIKRAFDVKIKMEKDRVQLYKQKYREIK